MIQASSGAIDSVTVSTHVMGGTESAGLITAPLSLPIEIVQLIMDQLYNSSTPEDHCYHNQLTYHHWSLVCRAWRPYSQALLFRTVELTDAAALRRFAAVLDTAPHLAAHVKFLRVYSRHLHTPENVLACVPVVLGTRLIGLQALAVTRVRRRDDVWHPHALLPPLPCELPYVPLPSHFFDALPVVGNVTVVKMYWVTFESFRDFVRTLHTLTNLRTLICIKISWRHLGELPLFMVSAQRGAPRRTQFLPKLRDLTVSLLNVHGTERLLSALDGSQLTKLSIDCPTYHPWTARSTFNLTDPFTGRGLGVDLRHLPHLRSLWISVPYTLASFPELLSDFASLLRSWDPGSESGTREGTRRTRTLTITPSYEYDYTRRAFVNILHVLGAVTERALLDEDATRPSDTLYCDASTSQKGDIDRGADAVIVEVCVIDKEEYRRGWWRRIARECFPRLCERGRLRSTFSKENWDYWEWKDIPGKSGTPDTSVEGELSPNSAARPDWADGGHPGPQRAPDDEESVRPRRDTRTKNAKLRKRLKRPFRALAGILVGVHLRLKLGKLKTVVLRPREV